MTDILCHTKHLPETGSGMFTRSTGFILSHKQYTDNKYAAIATEEDDGFEFREHPDELNKELEVLNAGAKELEEWIAENLVKLIT